MTHFSRRLSGLLPIAMLMACGAAGVKLILQDLGLLAVSAILAFVPPRAREAVPAAEPAPAS